ncbi:Pyridoxamine 5'-phosphate oxidase [Planctomicrobium piriforme]|uniref:Pyridoxamine 5'-phosphate oxidase n=1 Tax=Planctomicrobium piriforme TaxID=1576369 RepID=A0A1I3CXC2_9PLAN|nr:Pyridoxamine 5'-phosphate oxidase [Planctomicrobium piriforme]
MFEATELTLDAWTTTAWTELGLAASNLSHPWSHMVLGTVSENGPRQRTVILRAVGPENWQMVFFTDLRSPKIAELQRDPRISCLCYDAVSRVQMTVSGRARLHLNDTLSKLFWERIPVDSRRNYVGLQPPGALIDPPSTNLSSELPETGLTEEQRAHGRDHFAVVEIKAHSWEILQLRRSGNFRAKFWTSGESCEGTWIEP